MKRPIEAGCLAKVIGGLLGDKSPNIGLAVKVINVQGEHSKFGRIWRCEAAYATRGQPGTEKLPFGVHDFAQAWLERIDPPASTWGVMREKEVTA